MSRWNSIYAAGIFWDPEEPLPAELQSELEDYGPPGHEAHAHIALHTQVPGFGSYAQFDASHGTKQKILIRKQTPLPQFTVQQQGRNVLPPRSVTADVSIVQDTAKVAVTQLFWNDASAPIKEAAFTFPLPSGCTVTEFTCRIGNSKIIRGAVKPKDDARQAFKKHIRTHDTAAGLLEQATPEIFTTTLGNLPAQTKVQVQLTYITVLKHHFTNDTHNTITTLILPTSIAPRYGPAPKDADIAAASTNVPQGLTLNVEIIEAGRITTITSPSSHAITVTRQRGAQTALSFADLAGQTAESRVETASVVLADGPVMLERDFVLDITSTSTASDEEEASETGRPQAWLEHHPTLAKHKTLMLTLPPKCLTTAPLPTSSTATTTSPPNTPPHEILLLADRSGSMRRKMPALQSALHFFLKGIPLGRVFNIWCFGTSYSSWQPASVAYTQENLKNALGWVQSPEFRADMGGTELLPALEAMLGPLMEEDDHHDDEDGDSEQGGKKGKKLVDVIILTDGQTWRLEQTIELVRKARDRSGGRVRVFALGIGNQVSHALVDGLAKAGGGYAEVVPERVAVEGWEERVVGMTKAALVSRHLGMVRVVFGVREGDKIIHSTLADAKRSPADVSALSPFEHNRIYFHLPSSITANSATLETVHLELEADGQHTTFPIPVTVLPKPDTTLHKLAARAMLDDLERGTSSIHLGPYRPSPGTREETNLVRREAEKIACKWSLVSKWTSFFLAEEPCPPPAVPFAMSEKDLVANGIIEVKPGPGEDLLEPRGPAAAREHVAAIEPVELDPGSIGSIADRSRRHGQEVVDSLVVRPNFYGQQPPPVHGVPQRAAPMPPGAPTDVNHPQSARPAAYHGVPPMLQHRTSGPQRLNMNREWQLDEEWSASAQGTSWYLPPSPPQPRSGEEKERLCSRFDRGAEADADVEWVKKRGSGRERDRERDPDQERERLRKRFDSAEDPRAASAAQANPDTGFDAEFSTFTAGSWSDTIELTPDFAIDLTPAQLTQVNSALAKTSYRGPGSAAPAIVPMGPDAFRQPSHSAPSKKSSKKKKKKAVYLPDTELAAQTAQTDETDQTAETVKMDQTDQTEPNPRSSSPIASDANTQPTGESSTPALSPPSSPEETFAYQPLDFYADRRYRFHSRPIEPAPEPEPEPEPALDHDRDRDQTPSRTKHRRASRRYSSYKSTPRGAKFSRSGGPDDASDNDDNGNAKDKDKARLPPPSRPPRSPPRSPPTIISSSVTGNHAGHEAGNYSVVPLPVMDRLRDRISPAQFMAPKKLEKPTERSFVNALLRYQEFDGAIDFGSWEVAEEVLGREVVKALRGVLGRWTGGKEAVEEEKKERVDPNPDLSASTTTTETTNPNPDTTPTPLLTKLLWTTATHHLLARDFRATKSLWDLIVLKAVAYCASQQALLQGVEAGDVKAVLVGLKTPVHREVEVQVKNDEDGKQGRELWQGLRKLGREKGDGKGQEGEGQDKQGDGKIQQENKGEDVGKKKGDGVDQSGTVDVGTAVG